MNPLFQAISGGFSHVQGGMGQSPLPMMNGQIGALHGAVQRAQNLAQSLHNPQQMIQQFFPDAPGEVRNDPDQMIGWLQQTGRFNPQAVQMVRQMLGR